MSKMRSLATGILIVAAGAAISVYFIKTKPKAKRKPRVRMTPVVECEQPVKADHQAGLDLLGTVVPARSIVVRSRVAGEILRVHPHWVEGGTVGKGEALVQIDPADYRVHLQQAQATLAQAESDAMLEQGRQQVAAREWKMLGNNDAATESERGLALRLPQLKAVQARVAAARAGVERATLDLERTTVKAPFNAMILRRHSDVGDQATPQAALAELVDTDRYHVLVSVPVDDLEWVDVGTGEQPGSRAVVTFADGATSEGPVIGRLGDLEEGSRMARVLAEIVNPLARDTPALLNSFVSVVLEGKTIEDAYAIHPDLLRDNDEIWLVTPDGKLRVLPVQPLWSGKDKVVFRAEIAEDERVITSALGVAIDGMDLRVRGEDPSRKDNGTPHRPEKRP